MERITGRSNPLMVRVRKLRDDRKMRRTEKIFLCDGVKMLYEALKWHASIETVILSDGMEIPPLEKNVRCVTVPTDLMRSISPMQSPQGVLFFVRFPNLTLPNQLPNGQFLVLDGLQDPGNVGTILRTADAFGCKGVLLVNHCADPFSPKAVRATMGAIFRIPIWEADVSHLCNLMHRSNLRLTAATLCDDAPVLPCADLSNTAIVIGNEGAGVSEELLSHCNDMIQIPMEASCESLNAATAAAVILWEQYRRENLC